MQCQKIILTGSSHRRTFWRSFVCNSWHLSPFVNIFFRSKIMEHLSCSKSRSISITIIITSRWQEFHLSVKYGMYPESPLDRIPTGRNPHWTESPPEIHAVGIPFLGARNPHWTESPLDGSHRVYLYTLIKLYSVNVKTNYIAYCFLSQVIKVWKRRRWGVTHVVKVLSNPGMWLKADYL